MAAFTPGAYGVQASYNYVAAYDLHKPDYDSKLTQKYGSQLITELMTVLGRKVATSSLQYNHFEEDRIMPKIYATAPGGLAGAAVTFTLGSTSPSQSLSEAQAAPYIGSTISNKAVPVRANDIILIRPASGTTSASTYIRAFVTSVNASAGTFSATPVDINDSIPAIGSDQEIIIIGNAFGEGSGQPISRQTRVIKYTNNLQIIKENYDITNTEKDVVMWVEAVDPNTGKKGFLWYIKGEPDTYKQFLNYRELQMVLGEKLTNTAIANTQATAGTPIKMTEGLIPFILGGGTITNYSNITGWTLADGETMVKNMDKEKAAKENWLWAGINLSINIDSELRNTFQNGAISYGAFNMNKDLAVNMQFSSFKIGEYTFHKKTYDAFNDVQTLGATGYGFPNEGMVVPSDKKLDYGTKEMVDTFRMRYLVAPGGQDSREIKTVAVDMFNIDGTDKYQVRYASEVGFEGFAANRFAYIKQA